MSAVKAKAYGPLTFCYARPAGFSGQKAATQLVLNGLRARGWTCRELPQPVWDRDGGWPGRLRYLLGVLRVWLAATRLLGTRRGGLWVGMGQTRASFVRDAVPLLLGRLGLGRERVTIALNGSLFMQWAEGSLDLRLFRWLLGHAGRVVVVGNRQRQRLLAIGLSADRAVVIVNSCELAPRTEEELTARTQSRGPADHPVRCLFLSSLIDSKGYPEYLEALARLATAPGRRIEAVLCGRLVASDFSQRFPDAAAARRWIGERIAAINGGPRVTVRWVEGAAGAEKAALFHATDVFVLPTHYAVEAQPLVLLEAMAAGCAIITTRIAEIPTILEADTARFVQAPASDELAVALQGLVEDAEARERLALAALRRFRERYQIGKHLDAWEALLLKAGTNGGNAS